MRTLYPLVSFCLVFFTQVDAQVKTVLIEEFSSTSCSLCPPRTQELKNWSEASAQHIAIVHHARSNDNMSNLEPGLELGDLYKVYAQPTVFLNRIYYPNTDEDLALSINGDLFAKAEVELNESSPISIDFVDMSWNPTTNIIDGVIAVEFFDSISEDHNIGLYIVEDNVTGGIGGPTLQYGDPNASNFTGVSAYDQKASDANWVAQNHPDLVYEDQFIEKYPHFNVVRGAPFGTFGLEDVLPNIPSEGSTTDVYISVEIPEYFDPTSVGEAVDLNQIKLVAFFAKKSDDILDRSIINSSIIELSSFMDVSSTVELQDDHIDFSLSPNPLINYLEHEKYSSITSFLTYLFFPLFNRTGKCGL